MPEQSTLTYEGILELFRETDRRMKETDRLMKEVCKKISDLGSRTREIIESMIKGNIVEKFQELGYEVTEYGCEKSFKNNNLGISGDIDMFLDDGEVAIFIEVEDSLETADVRKHIERLEKYRRHTDTKGVNKRRFIGAVAGVDVSDDAIRFAQESGLYVIVQSREAVEIVTPPAGFQAKEW